MFGYHFVGETLSDGRPIPPDGEWIINGEAVQIDNRNVYSRLPSELLSSCSPGPTICLIEIDGTRLRIIKRIDATQLLSRFGADLALSVRNFWKMPSIVKQYLNTLDESIRLEARDAATKVADAAYRTAHGDVEHAAAKAAQAAARDASWVEVRAAAWETKLQAAKARAHDASSSSPSRDIRQLSYDRALDARLSQFIVEFNRRVEAAFAADSAPDSAANSATPQPIEHEYNPAIVSMVILAVAGLLLGLVMYSAPKNYDAEHERNVRNQMRYDYNKH